MERVNENEQTPKRDNKRIVIGLVLIAIAGLLFADNFDVLPWNWEHYVFTWQSILIVIGLISLAKNKSVTTGIILISIGVFFLVIEYFNYPFGVHHLFWPAILAVVGVLLIVRQKNQHLFSGKEK
jgi:membrane-bound ClpP family serine protease